MRVAASSYRAGTESCIGRLVGICARDARPAADGARDRDRAVKRGQPVGKATQPAAGAGVGAADPVVVDLDAQLIVELADPHRRPGRAWRTWSRWSGPRRRRSTRRPPRRAGSAPGRCRRPPSTDVRSARDSTAGPESALGEDERDGSRGPGREARRGPPWPHPPRAPGCDGPPGSPPSPSARRATCSSRLSETSRCWAPSWRSRSTRRRSRSPASTIRAREARTSSSWASTWPCSRALASISRRARRRATRRVPSSAVATG